jgi:hypothetical protein
VQWETAIKPLAGDMQIDFITLPMTSIASKFIRLPVHIFHNALCSFWYADYIKGLAWYTSSDGVSGL